MDEREAGLDARVSDASVAHSTDRFHTMAPVRPPAVARQTHGADDSNRSANTLAAAAATTAARQPVARHDHVRKIKLACGPDKFIQYARVGANNGGWTLGGWRVEGAGFGIRGDSESDGIGRIDGDIFRSSSSRRRRALGIGIGDRQTPMERGIICVLHTHKQAHTGHKWVSNGAGGGLCDGDCDNGVREEENKGESESERE